jgi:2-dehydropantoate 2-reductase
MRVAVIGIGAMGCLFGAKLSQVAEVTLVGHWPAQLKALRERGLCFIQPDGRSQIIHLQTTNEPKTVAPADLALILVKSYQTQPAAETAWQLLAPTGMALTLQNGLGNLETLTAVLGPLRASLGITSEGAALQEPGIVRHAGTGHTYLVDPGETAGASQEIVSLFQAAGFPTTLSADADGLVWGKLAVNAGINPLTAVLQVANGFLAENAAARALMTLAAQEVAAVAAAQNIQLPFPDAAAQALKVAQATAANHSSMRQDLANGRPTEIGAICGAVVAAGRRVGVATPVNAVLQTAVQQAEQGTWPEAPTTKARLQLLHAQVKQFQK